MADDDPAYISPPIEVDAPALEQNAYTYLQAVFPDWRYRPASLTAIQTEAFMEQVADLTSLAAAVPDAVTMRFGRLFDVVPTEAAPASATTTWTMVDDSGYEIPEGTVIRFLVGGDTYVYFQTVDTYAVSPGSIATAPGSVLVQALSEGVIGNDLAIKPELVDILDYVEDVDIVGTTFGGVDEQDIGDFLEKFARRLRLMADRPIHASEFAAYAELIDGVYRAYPIDNYNPADDTYDNEKMVGLALFNQDGTEVDTDKQAEVKADLEAVREWNFVINIVHPTYTPVTIDVTVKPIPDSDPAFVADATEGALLDFLSFANWSFDEKKVRYNDVTALVKAVDPVLYVETLSINGGAAGADLTLAGAVALPGLTPTINVTVDA